MNWLLIFPLWLLINVLARVFALALACFAIDADGLIDNANGTGIEPRLPHWLAWFQTPDNSLLGDGAWKRMEAGHWPWRAKFAAFPRLQAYLGRLGWLWRNPACGFDLAASARLDATDEIVVRGDPEIRDQPIGKTGRCCTRIGRYWNLVVVARLYGDRCLMLNFGWSLKTFAEHPALLKSNRAAPYACSARFSTLKGVS